MRSLQAASAEHFCKQELKFSVIKTKGPELRHRDYHSSYSQKLSFHYWERGLRSGPGPERRVFFHGCRQYAVKDEAADTYLLYVPTGTPTT